MNKQKFSFKVVSIGTFEQLMLDQTTILNRPCIQVDEKKIRYGNEYILFDKSHQGSICGKTFLGSFSIDKNNNINLKLFKEIDVPINPEYYLLTINHVGDRIDKSFDLIKSNSNSLSRIFSSAYYKDEAEETYRCETMILVQHADIVIINGKKHLFYGKSESLI